VWFFSHPIKSQQHNLFNRFQMEPLLQVLILILMDA
jgi:hypothetical protein